MTLNDLLRDAAERLCRTTVADAAYRLGIALIVVSLLWMAGRAVA